MEGLLLVCIILLLADCKFKIKNRIIKYSFWLILIIANVVIVYDLVYKFIG